MRLIFLGTSAGAPTRTRNVTSSALHWLQAGRFWLFDCGEGTQQRVQQSPVRLSHLDKIFISHMHGDHVFGLPGLMASRSSSMSVTSELTIYGPEPLEELLRTILAVSHTRIKFPWKFVPLVEGVLLEDDLGRVECRLLNHGIPSYGFAIIEKEQPAQFDVRLANDLGIPSGPLFGKLKSGQDIVLSDGTVVEASRFVGVPKRQRKLVICGDTGVSDSVIELACDCDLLVHEATFMSDQTARAIEVGHSTAVQAAEAARGAGARKLILTHFSPRYDQHGASVLSELLTEAQALFPNTSLAEDLLVVDIQHRESDVAAKI